jgi:flagellar assembly factor FliW
MPILFKSSRFGTVELSPEQLLHFPLGLIGIPGTAYALLLPREGALFPWLQSLHDPGFALPVVDPTLPYPEFQLVLDPQDERLLAEHRGERRIYVTVTARPDPRKTTVNLRAPIVIVGQTGFQLLNLAEGAELRAPLLAGERAAA